MTDFEKPVIAPPPTEEEIARDLADIRECEAILKAAKANPGQEQVAALTKVATRLRNVRPTVDVDAQLALLQGVCLFFLSRDRDLPFAMEAAQLLLRLARIQDRKPQLLNGLFVLAQIATQLDNHVEAVEACCTARETAVEMGYAEGESAAVANGASMYINIGYYEWALEALRTALTICDRCSPAHAAKAEWTILTNIAQCHLFLGTFAEGLRTAEAARTIAEHSESYPGSSANRAVLEFTILRLLFALGRRVEMKPVFERLQALVAEVGSPRARIDLSTARGLMDVAEGRREIGLSRLAATQEKASIIPSTLPDVLTAMIAAYEGEGMEDEARRSRDQLMSILANRQQTARLRAALMPHHLGSSGQVARGSEYDRRLDAARERLLRAGDG